MANFRADPITTETVELVSGASGNLFLNSKGVVIQTVGATMALRSGASAAVTGSDPNYGFFWVSSSSPTTPYFRNSVGTDIPLSSSGGGGGSSDHATLTNLSWSAGGHNGPSNEVARFNAGEEATGSSGLTYNDGAGILRVERAVTIPGVGAPPPAVSLGDGSFFVSNDIPVKPYFVDDSNLALPLVRTVVSGASPGVSFDRLSGYHLGTLWVDQETSSSYVQAEESGGAGHWGVTYAPSFTRRNTADNSISGTTVQTLDYEEQVPAGYVWDNVAQHVTCSDGGRYLIHFHGSFRKTTGTLLNVGALYVEGDAGGGFSPIGGLTGEGSGRATNSRWQVSCDLEVTLPANTAIRLVADQPFGSDTIVVSANTAALSIRKIRA